ncbi:hypothetical protein [Yoonia sp. I 8.24]|uniref:hypothetical protein n=1 Tax=Yoonia sp. I 8.24 TaxID=1537229 RepID=UPI001EDF8E3B|nr:hypothetical protein [Yoonia sp. I 8.24]MCG3267901.1 hypothetical protein [Yoonia sp. I 8.24]
MKLLDLEHPFFTPVGVRVAVVAVCAVWGLIELVNGAVFWTIFFLGLAVICGWRFATIDYVAVNKAQNHAEKE